MLIKLQRSKSSHEYIILDNLTEVGYGQYPVNIPDFSGTDIEIYANEPLGKPDYAFYNKLSCTKDGDRVDVYFDGEAYLCNDDGKTLHRFFAIPDSKKVSGATA